jgi:UDP-N-acetylmuramate dehydrogenase
MVEADQALHAPSDPAAAPSLLIERDVPLAPLSTLGVGGSARFFARAQTRDDARLAAHWAQERDLPLFPLGGGSNVVFGDQGFAGLVLELALSGIQWRLEGARAYVTAAAGEVWDDVVTQAIARQCAGIECLSGIPGRVGAAPIQNIGAYGQDLAARLVSVDALDCATLRDVTLDREACRLGYRSSLFKTTNQPRQLIVLRITLALEPGGAPCLAYDELAAAVRDRVGAHPQLSDVRAAVIELRRTKSMLNDPDDPCSRSVGSFFVNPILTTEEHARAEAYARRSGSLGRTEQLRAIPLPDGNLKIPAAWLIERAGFRRGERRGRVGLSERHALALVNYGGATAQEVLGLAREIVDKVRRRFSIQLSPEPVLVSCALD